MSFGTCCCGRTVAEKLLKCLLEANNNVLIAASGQKDISSIESSDERVRFDLRLSTPVDSGKFARTTYFDPVECETNGIMAQSNDLRDTA